MAVYALERYADAEIDADSFRKSTSRAHPMNAYRDELFTRNRRENVWYAGYGINWAINLVLNLPTVCQILDFFALAVCPNNKDSGVDRANSGQYQAEATSQADLIRDIFGPSGPRTPETSVLGWNDGIVVKLATVIYAERALPEGRLDRSRLSVLADAFEDAGGNDVNLLSHCREPGDHVRGCWVVDLLLGKE
jgi:hypothetical protein